MAHLDSCAGCMGGKDIPGGTGMPHSRGDLRPAMCIDKTHKVQNERNVSAL